MVQAACDSFFPADLLLLASANADGTAYVETVNLDGESNLKIKKALDATRLLSADAVARLQARMASDLPVRHVILGKDPNFIRRAGCNATSARTGPASIMACLSDVVIPNGPGG